MTEESYSKLIEGKKTWTTDLLGMINQRTQIVINDFVIIHLIIITFFISFQNDKL